MPTEQFLYDDFFSPEDAPGVPRTIEVRGRKMEIGLRVLSFGDMKRLMSSNARVVVVDGKPQIEMIQDQDGDTDFILAALRSWPFKNRDGSMVPINKQTLSEMHADVLTAILREVTEFSQANLKTQMEAINGPFGKA